MTGDLSAQRDAHLRLVRRLRVGLVSVGVVGSLGVAGVVATHPHAVTAGQTSPGPAQPAQVGRNGSGDDFSDWQGDGGENDDGTARNQQIQPPAPGLQPGVGQSQGSTSGS